MCRSPSMTLHAMSVLLSYTLYQAHLALRVPQDTQKHVAFLKTLRHGRAEDEPTSPERAHLRVGTHHTLALPLETSTYHELLLLC